MLVSPLWVPWLDFQRPWRQTAVVDRPSAPPVLGVCPHCTNTDTLTLHCRDNRCGWSSCTCGALIYSRRRHRHPRHRSAADTCHDPAAAV
jgi:hypothetical protein